jgi:hypothetical protein
MGIFNNYLLPPPRLPPELELPELDLELEPEDELEELELDLAPELELEFDGALYDGEELDELLLELELLLLELEELLLFLPELTLLLLAEELDDLVLLLLTLVLLLVVDLEPLLPEVREDTLELLLPLLETPTLLKSTSELLVLPLELRTEDELLLLPFSSLLLLLYPDPLRPPVFLKFEYVFLYFECPG